MAARGYTRALHSNPDLALNFGMLEAEAMLWRGMPEDALKVLPAKPSDRSNANPRVRWLALNGVARSYTGDSKTAAEDLAQAQDLCLQTPVANCGEVLRALGVWANRQSPPGDAKKYFLQTLAFAQAHGDKSLEATALLNLGDVAFSNELYDETLDWSWAAYAAGLKLKDENQVQGASGNLGVAYLRLGDAERARERFQEAESGAASVGNRVDRLTWHMDIGQLYLDAGRLQLAEQTYNEALQLAQEINSIEDIATIRMNLAWVAIANGNPQQAERLANQALANALQSGNKIDLLNAKGILLEIAAQRGDSARAEQLLQEVEAAPESETTMKLSSQHAMARLYEKQGKFANAEREYAVALATFEAARKDIHKDSSQLPFASNATHIYDDSIHFLVSQGRIEDALLQADQSRARTLAEGFEGNSAQQPNAAPTLRPQQVARKTNSTLLFYWLGEKQSYLWTITPDRISLSTLPPAREIETQVQRYSKALQGVRDPLTSANPDGTALYSTLVAPAAEALSPNRPVMILADGALSELNFETLIVPSADARPHYWIEDATIMAAPSLAMLAAAKPARAGGQRMLLLGDAIPPGDEYPKLRWAALEMSRIESHFAGADAVVFARQQATPAAYLASDPGRFSYIHFVSHGFASRTEPLDSAIILSRPNAPGAAVEDSFKLYARDVMQHPIDARLVTISACNTSGARSYAGEGLVGLSWAFLRAGAHNAIGSLWEASDESTPRLMDSLYEGLQHGDSPGVALRRAKLTLLHTDGRFRTPFYWAPFQLYTRG